MSDYILFGVILIYDFKQCDTDYTFVVISHWTVNIKKIKQVKGEIQVIKLFKIKIRPLIMKIHK